MLRHVKTILKPYLFEALGQDFRVGRRPEAADVRGGGVGGGRTFGRRVKHAAGEWLVNGW